MQKRTDQYEPAKTLTKEERDARALFRQTQATAALAEREVKEKAFYENRERLKAERLAREAEAKTKTK